MLTTLTRTAFNRTSVELKLAFINIETSSSRRYSSAFNRTSVELKHTCEKDDEFSITLTFNRTSVELKQRRVNASFVHASLMS